jgi:hypothetical protein
MDYQHHNSFNLTDPKTGKTKNLTTDFGGIIINTNEEVYEKECMPQLNFTTDKNDMRDGEIFLNATYGIREIPMTVLFSEELGGGDLFELKKWLGKKYQQIFNWDEDLEEKEILAIESGGWKSQVYYTKHFFGKIDLKFICHYPYYSRIKDRDITFTNLVIGENYKVKSKGNSDSYPLIKIISTTPSIVFQWNDLTITLNYLTTNPIYLDCEKNICYEIINGVKVLVTSKFSSTDYMDFPEIFADDDNYVKLLSGTVSSMTVSPNTRII